MSRLRDVVGSLGGAFPVFIGEDPSAVTVDDFDGDPTSRIDLAVTNRADDTVSLRFNSRDQLVFADAEEFDVGVQPLFLVAGYLDADVVVNGADLRILLGCWA